MNITKLAADALKLLPKTFTRKQFLIGVAAGLGAGVSTTSLFNCGGKENKIGDDFERQETTEQKADSIQQSDMELTDTSYHYVTDEIARINYYDKDTNLVHFKEFDFDGNLEKHTWLDSDKKNKYGEYIDYTVLDANGNEIKTSIPSSDGGWYTKEVSKRGIIVEQFYNKYGEAMRMRLGGIVDISCN